MNATVNPLAREPLRNWSRASCAQYRHDRLPRACAAGRPIANLMQTSRAVQRRD